MTYNGQSDSRKTKWGKYESRNYIFKENLYFWYIAWVIWKIVTVWSKLSSFSTLKKICFYYKVYTQKYIKQLYSMYNYE